MTDIKCSIKNCPTIFHTDGPVSKDVSYICSGRGTDGFPIPGHTRKEQVEANDRIYNAKKDNQDAEVKFQPFQFDNALSSGGSSGTYTDDDMNRRKDKE